MTRKQHIILGLTLAGTLIAGFFAAMAFGHNAPVAAKGWAVTALCLGSIFKIRLED